LEFPSENANFGIFQKVFVKLSEESLTPEAVLSLWPGMGRKSIFCQIFVDDRNLSENRRKNGQNCIKLRENA